MFVMKKMINCEVIKSFSGHSQCRVELCRSENGFLFVRKTSTKANYDIRLLNQCSKQRMFNKLSLHTPLVYQRGLTENGRFYFDMEFIKGRTLAFELFNLTTEYEDQLISDFFRHIDAINKKNNNNNFVNNVFHKKIDELMKSVENDNVLAYVVKKLLQFDYSQVPMTLCAGDLTLENIIYSNGKVYVIDLLDSFFSSWLIDIAKLRQDTFLGWSYRNVKLEDKQVERLNSLDQKLKKELEKRDKTGYLLIASQHILLLNILRIIPYCQRNDENFNFCKKSLERLMAYEFY